MAQAIQTVSIPPEMREFIGGVIQATFWYAVGWCITIRLIRFSQWVPKAMANAWYKKQRRFLSQVGKENFVEIRMNPHANYGEMPHAYNTGKGVWWIPRHYAALCTHLQTWHGSVFTGRVLLALSRDWWRALDPYKAHILLLAEIPDQGRTLREWVYEVNPHTAFAPIPDHEYHPDAPQRL